MSRDLIQEIFELDRGIRYVAILDHKGGHIEGGMRPEVSSLNPVEEEDKLFLQCTVSRGMSESWTKYFDRFRFSIVAHEKVNVFQFPFHKNILLVTANPNVAFDVVEKITSLLEAIS